VNDSLYWSALVVGLLAVLVPALVLNITGKPGPRRENEAKYGVYECGVPPEVDARVRFSSKFYLVAILFVLFDIEAAFLIPWVFAFRSMADAGLSVLRDMALFLGVLVVGLVYVVKKGALQWE
jgi:NADH-quinone oxidoreductase subunit A